MPKIADFIDDLRDAFGKECIDAQMRKGMKGDPVFFAQGSGYRVGTPLSRDGVFISYSQPAGIALARKGGA